LLTKINTLFINVFIIFKIFISVVNLKKAKKHILENVFYINTLNEVNSEESFNDFKIINTNNGLKKDNKISDIKTNHDKRSFFIDSEKIKQKLFSNQESIFLEFNKKQFNDLDYSEEHLECKNELQLYHLKNKVEGAHNNDGSRERKDSFFDGINISIDNKKEENLQHAINNSPENDLKNKMLNIANKLTDKQNQGFSNDNNLNILNNKTIANQKPNKNKKRLTMLSTIKEKFFNENKLNRKINLRSILKMFICCRFNQINKINKIYSFAEDKFDDFVNIKNFIKKMQEMESIKNILFNEDGQTLFNFVSRPRFSIQLDENENIITNKNPNSPKLSCFNNQENLYSKFLSINNKIGKTDLEKKLMEVFIEKLN
jgi:hypothetical protein